MRHERGNAGVLDWPIKGLPLLINHPRPFMFAKAIQRKLRHRPHRRRSFYQVLILRQRQRYTALHANALYPLIFYTRYPEVYFRI